MTSVVEVCKQVPDSMAPENFFVLSALSRNIFYDKLFIKVYDKYNIYVNH